MIPVANMCAGRGRNEPVYRPAAGSAARRAGKGAGRYAAEQYRAGLPTSPSASAVPQRRHSTSPSTDALTIATSDRAAETASHHRSSWTNQPVPRCSGVIWRCAELRIDDAAGASRTYGRNRHQCPNDLSTLPFRPRPAPATPRSGRSPLCSVTRSECGSRRRRPRPRHVICWTGWWQAPRCCAPPASPPSTAATQALTPSSSSGPGDPATRAPTGWPSGAWWCRSAPIWRSCPTKSAVPCVTMTLGLPSTPPRRRPPGCCRPAATTIERRAS